MTMLDDDRLAELFGRAAEAFEVPETGIDEILARAEAGPDRVGAESDADASGDGDAEDGAGNSAAPDELARRRRLVAVAGRHRILSVAAVVVVALIVAGTIGAITRPPSNPTVTALKLNHKGAVAGSGANGSPATTTLPARHAGRCGSRVRRERGERDGTELGRVERRDQHAEPERAGAAPGGGRPAGEDRADGHARRGQSRRVTWRGR